MDLARRSAPAGGHRGCLPVRNYDADNGPPWAVAGLSAAERISWPPCGGAGRDDPPLLEMRDTPLATHGKLETLRHDHVFLGYAHNENARRTLWVVILTTVMMVGEIVAGTIFNSMALLADGFHMATHAGALAVAEPVPTPSLPQAAASASVRAKLEICRPRIRTYPQRRRARDCHRVGRASAGAAPSRS